MSTCTTCGAGFSVRGRKAKYPTCPQCKDSQIKRCTNCGATPGPQGFNRDRTRADGLSVWCSECCKQTTREHARSQPETYRNGYHMRRARLARKGGFPPLSTSELERLKLGATHCALCSREMSKAGGRSSRSYPTVDHIVPLGIGGAHTADNVRIVCRGCNLRRPKDGSDYLEAVAI